MTVSPAIEWLTGIIATAPNPNPATPNTTHRVGNGAFFDGVSAGLSCGCLDSGVVGGTTFKRGWDEFWGVVVMGIV
jgi:hypothetical protein